MQGRGQVEPDEEVLEDGIAFAGVAKFPARIKCALLSWMAFKDATAQVVTKEDVMTDTQHHDRPQRPARGPRGHRRRHRHRDQGRRRRGDEGRRRPRARHQRRRPRPGLRRAHRRALQRRARHDADLGGLPADRRHPGPDQLAPSRASSATSPSTGSGCRRGARTRSPTTAASSCARSASTSERELVRPRRRPLRAPGGLARGAGGVRRPRRRAGLDAPVPTAPGWNVRDLVAHQGMVHRSKHVIGAEAPWQGQVYVLLRVRRAA